MRRRRVQLAVALAACVLAASWCAAEAQAWNVRYVHESLTDPGNLFQTLPPNVDVMIDPTGVVRVGYALPSNSSAQLATLDGRAWRRDHLPALSDVSSFAMDAFGMVTWASSPPTGGPLIIGTDLDAFGGVVESPHPDGSLHLATLALDGHGRPAIVAFDLGGASPRALSRFDPQTGAWRQTPGVLPAFGMAGGITSAHSLAFTPDDRAVVGYFVQPQLISPLAMIVEDPVLGLGPRDIADGALGAIFFGNSVAVASTGEIGFAFVNDSFALTVGIYDGVGTTFETVSNLPSALTPRSLAVDPLTGQFVLAYTEDSFINTSEAEPLHLARRTGPGTWTDQTLPIDAMHASLAFDAAGHAYLGAVTPGFITLISDSPGVPALLPGDFNLDGIISGLDIQRFIEAFTDEAQYKADTGLIDAEFLTIADINGDTAFSGLDINPFVDLLTSGGVPQSQLAAYGLPEPAAGAMLCLLLTGVMARRRVRVSRTVVSRTVSDTITGTPTS